MISQNEKQVYLIKYKSTLNCEIFQCRKIAKSLSDCFRKFNQGQMDEPYEIISIEKIADSQTMQDINCFKSRFIEIVKVLKESEIYISLRIENDEPVIYFVNDIGNPIHSCLFPKVALLNGDDLL